MEWPRVDNQIDRNSVIDVDTDLNSAYLQRHIICGHGQVQILSFGQNIVSDRFGCGALGQPEWGLSPNIVLKFIGVNIDRDDFDASEDHRSDKSQRQ